MPKLPKQGRVKAKYNATPTQRERAYHLWLMENYSCICCGGRASVVHHPLERHPEQRWRRDHEYVVPMRADCHMALHAAGSEAAYDTKTSYPEYAGRYRRVAIEQGLL